MDPREKTRQEVRNIKGKIKWIPPKIGSPDGRICGYWETFCPVYNKTKPRECKDGLGKIVYGTGKGKTKFNKRKWNYCEYWDPTHNNKTED